MTSYGSAASKQMLAQCCEELCYNTEEKINGVKVMIIKAIQINKVELNALHHPLKFLKVFVLPGRISGPVSPATF